MSSSAPFPTPDRLYLTDDGCFPNSRHPLLIYRAALADDGDLAAAFEQHFAAHGWPPDWRDGIYDFHHYHSTAHEALGVAAGRARLLLGGPDGQIVEVRAGDALVLPAGTGHCALEQSADFLVVGAYPRGQRWDMMCGAASERPAALQRIAAVTVPDEAPLGGELRALWPD